MVERFTCLPEAVYDAGYRLCHIHERAEDGKHVDIVTGLLAAKDEASQRVSVYEKTERAEYTDDDAVMKTFCDGASNLHHFFLLIRKGDCGQQHDGQGIDDSGREK